MTDADLNALEEAASRWQPYPAYYDSGVEWLGDIPEHWEVIRLKYTVTECQNGNWGDEPQGDDTDLICVRVADFDRITARVLEPETLRSIPIHQHGKYKLKKGDLLLEKSGGGEQQPVGFVVLFDLEVDAVCSNFIAKMPVQNGYDPSFLNYLHNSLYILRINTKSIKQNTGIQNLDSSSYLSEPIATPAYDEQRQIAAFLDHQTAKIDRLIAKKCELIERLQEKRAALISHAVTKGLDPNAPMKDSGIEWLGEIPSHWDVRKLKYVGYLKSGETISPDQINKDDAYPVYGGNGLRGFTSAYTHDGDYPLIGRQGALCGNINYASGKFWASEHAVVVRVNPDVDYKWLGELLRAMNLNQYSQSAAQPGIAVDRIRLLEVPFPPSDEQSQIADFLDRQTAYIDDLIIEIEATVETLQEYRTAMISAAVTGKIDVRDWTPPDEYGE